MYHILAVIATVSIGYPIRYIIKEIPSNVLTYVFLGPFYYYDSQVVDDLLKARNTFVKSETK